MSRRARLGILEDLAQAGRYTSSLLHCACQRHPPPHHPARREAGEQRTITPFRARTTSPPHHESRTDVEAAFLPHSSIVDSMFVVRDTVQHCKNTEFLAVKIWMFVHLHKKMKFIGPRRLIFYGFVLERTQNQASSLFSRYLIHSLSNIGIIIVNKKLWFTVQLELTARDAKFRHVRRLPFVDQSNRMQRPAPCRRYPMISERARENPMSTM